MLTEKQQRFVDEYLIDLNASKAAIRAGYSRKTAGQIGFENLRRPEIQEAIQNAQNKLMKRTEVTQDRVIQELAKIAFSNVSDYLTFGPNGVNMFDSSKIAEDKTACISEVSETTTLNGGSTKFKLHDKVSALEKLGRHLGMFKDPLFNLPPGKGITEFTLKLTSAGEEDAEN